MSEPLHEPLHEQINEPQPMHATALWSKHRVEALTDGIFAVAMTLLVIDLKLPDPHTIHSNQDLAQALADLFPKALSWIISFFVLAIFWTSHLRLFHYLRHVDGGMVWRNVFFLVFVSLMPFSAALLGEFATSPISQVAYNGNMVMLGAMAMWKLVYLHRHPALSGVPMETGTYHAALLRTGSLVALAFAVVIVALVFRTTFATCLYLLMAPIGRYSRHVEARARARTAMHASSHPSNEPS